jgi:hypothetical protein
MHHEGMIMRVLAREKWGDVRSLYKTSTQQESLKKKVSLQNGGRADIVGVDGYLIKRLVRQHQQPKKYQATNREVLQ